MEWKRNLVAHGDAREEKWRGKRRMEWVAKQSSLSLGTVHPVLLQSFSPDPHSKKASTRLNWHLRRYKCTRPFRWKTESGFCACAITFRFHSNSVEYRHLGGVNRDYIFCASTFLFSMSVKFFISSQENKEYFSTCCKTSSYLRQITLESSSKHIALILKEFSQDAERLYDLINSSWLFLHFCRFQEI